jgi:hypothetical protein
MPCPDDYFIKDTMFGMGWSGHIYLTQKGGTVMKVKTSLRAGRGLKKR